MSTDQEDFKTQFRAVLDELTSSVRYDAEAVWWLGSLAGRLVAEARATSWSDLKARMSRDTFRTLLTLFERDGDALNRQGKVKAAYATRVLAISLLATGQKDKQMRRDERMFDFFIDTAANLYRKQQAATPTPAPLS